jgi:NAD(P)-dependent dehydrogenase (short-subunit alcohol dehydrogenase family)
MFAGVYDGKVALVSGAGSGIGRACAAAFGMAGAAVVAADVDVDSAASTAAAIGAAGGRALAVRCDVRSTAEVDAAVRRAVDVFGRLDVAHNNAGIDVPHVPLADVREDDWDAIIDVDLTGVWRCMRAEIPAMLDSGGGAIVNTSSMAGVMGVPGAAAYCSAKHGVIGLTRVAAIDYAGRGIRVNSITPGLVRTPLITHVLGDAVEDFVAARPTGRIPDPEHVADLVLWLCSPAAEYITGESIEIS